MLADDPRSEALGTRFAAQWLRLQDLDKVHPDVLLFPDFDQQLADAMRRETELFFTNLVREDRQHVRAVHGRLHVRERAARPSLRHRRGRRATSSAASSTRTTPAAGSSATAAS